MVAWWPIPASPLVVQLRDSTSLAKGLTSCGAACSAAGTSGAAGWAMAGTDRARERMPNRGTNLVRDMMRQGLPASSSCAGSFCKQHPGRGKRDLIFRSDGYGGMMIYH